MKSLLHRSTCRSRQQGAGMVETMIGILIGLLVVLVVYNLLAVSEGYKRTVTGVSDAQVTGLLAQFLAGRDAGNGGNGISLAAPDLVGCTDQNMRPAPVRITAGASAAVSDSFISMASGAPRVLWSVPLLTASSTPSSGDEFEVQSPNGFSNPDGSSAPTATVPYRVVVIDGAGSCQLVYVTSVTSPPDAATGSVKLTFDAATMPTGTFTGGPGAAAPARVLILGPDPYVTRIRYEVYNTSAAANCSAANAQGCQLVTTDMLQAVPTRAPIAQNVVLMKAQYGVDTNNDHQIDCWTAADSSNTCADGKDYTNIADPAQFPFIEDFNRILAVRIGIVVRSDEPDLKGLDRSLIGTARTTVDGDAGIRQPVYLFNCSTNTDAACQGRVQVPDAATVSLASPNCAPGIICDGWRYSVYETIIPLRNTLFNSTL